MSTPQRMTREDWRKRGFSVIFRTPYVYLVNQGPRPIYRGRTGGGEWMEHDLCLRDESGSIIYSRPDLWWRNVTDELSDLTRENLAVTVQTCGCGPTDTGCCEFCSGSLTPKGAPSNQHPDINELVPRAKTAEPAPPAPDRYEALAAKMDAISRDWEGNPVRSGCYAHAAQIIRANAKPEPEPESPPATTSAGAIRAAHAIWTSADYSVPSNLAKSDLADIIDREAALSELVAACRIRSGEDHDEMCIPGDECTCSVGDALAAIIAHDRASDEPPAPTPTAGAMRAINALGDNASLTPRYATPNQTKQDWAAIIDRATGLPALLAAIDKCADGLERDARMYPEGLFPSVERFVNRAASLRAVLAKHDGDSDEPPPKCFDGMTRKPLETQKSKGMDDFFRRTVIVICPVCNGYGGWKVSEPSQSEVFCVQCHGWGWVDRDGPDHRCPKHEWNTYYEGKNIHGWKCTKCPATRLVDSSG